MSNNTIARYVTPAKAVVTVAMGWAGYKAACGGCREQTSTSTGAPGRTDACDWAAAHADKCRALPLK